MALGEEGTKDTRIIFQGKAGEDEQLPALESPSPGAVIDGADHVRGPSGECFRLPLPGLTFTRISMPLHTRGERC